MGKSETLAITIKVILQEVGSTHVPPTQPVFRVVLLHTELAVQDLCPGKVT